MKRIILVAVFFFFFTSFMCLNAQWARTYGGSDLDYAYSIQQTSDGGYIVTGYTYSFGAGEPDVWILKLSSTGVVEWQRTYGGISSDAAFSIQQTSDGGYIVAGETYSFGAGDWDIWVLKLSSDGTVEWQRTYGGIDEDYAWSIHQTADGGYIVSGNTASFGAGEMDAWILKLSSVGAVEWQRTYGGSSGDYAYSIQQTSDGGYIVAGETYSFGAGDWDIWVLKLSSTGTIEWQRTYGGSSGDYAYSIQQTSDGGYIAAGFTRSFGAGGPDYSVLKLYSDGAIDSSCGFIGSSNASVVSTSVSPGNTNVTPLATSVTPLATSVTPQNSNASVVLLCEAPRYAISISATTGGATDPAQGSHTYYYRTEVQIEAIQETNYRFSGWTGDVPSGHESDNPITITMDAAKSVTANFIRQYILTVAAGIGGTTNPSPGSYTHDTGAAVNITATPSSGYQFSGWSGAASGTTSPITITMDSNKSISANFSQIPSGDTGDGGGGGCFIATAAYGSPLHSHLDILRDFRDTYLMHNEVGKKLVRLYYNYSPYVADLIAKYKVLRIAVRINLLPLVVFSYSMLHFDRTITAFVLAFIFALPIFFIWFYRRK